MVFLAWEYFMAVKSRGLLVGHPWGIYAHTPFLSLYAHTFSPIFFFKINFKKFWIFSHFNLQLNFSKITISKFNFFKDSIFK